VTQGVGPEFIPNTTKKNKIGSYFTKCLFDWWEGGLLNKNLSGSGQSKFYL
jgi:hypothetical protein